MTPEMLRMIRESVDASEYASTSEVVRNAMRYGSESGRNMPNGSTPLGHAFAAHSMILPDVSGQDADAALEAVLAKVDEDLDRAAS